MRFKNNYNFSRGLMLPNTNGQKNINLPPDINLEDENETIYHIVKIWLIQLIIDYLLLVNILQNVINKVESNYTIFRKIIYH